MELMRIGQVEVRRAGVVALAGLVGAQEAQE